MVTIDHHGLNPYFVLKGPVHSLLHSAFLSGYRFVLMVQGLARVVIISLCSLDLFLDRIAETLIKAPVL